jgi:hypothetical protein
MIRYILVLLLLIPSTSWGWQLIGSGVTATEDYSDIVFFWTAESTTFGDDDYSAGDNTPSANGSGLTINSTAGIIGTNGIFTTTSGGRFYSFSVGTGTSRIFPASGRMGFWLNNPNTTKVTPVYFQIDSSNRGQLDIENNDVSVYWRYNNATEGTCASNSDVISTGTHFIEFAWGSGYRQVWVDGTSVLNCSTTTTEQDFTDISFGDADAVGDTSAEYMDNIMISNDVDRDFYNDGLHELTSSPR